MPQGLLPPCTPAPNGRPVRTNVTNLGAAGVETSITATELASRTLGSPKPGTRTVPRAVARSAPETASALGKPKAGKGSPVAVAWCGIGARDGLVFEQTDIGDVERAAVRREGEGEGQASGFDGRDYLARMGVDHRDAEVSLIHHVEEVVFGIERQISGIAVGVAGGIEVDAAPSFAGPVEMADLTGVTLRNPSRVVAGEGGAHEYAAPPGEVAVVGVVGAGTRVPVVDLPGARAIQFEDAERVAARAGIGGEGAPAAGAHR